MRDYACAEDFIRQGGIVRVNGYLTFPDGSRVHRHTTAGNPKGAIDEHYAHWTAGAPAPTTTSGFKRDSLPHITTTNVLTAPNPDASLFHYTPVVENNAVVVETIADKSDTLATTRSRSHATHSNSSESAKGKNKAGSTVTEPLVSKPTPAYI